MEPAICSNSVDQRYDAQHQQRTQDYENAHSHHVIPYALLFGLRHLPEFEHARPAHAPKNTPSGDQSWVIVRIINRRQCWVLRFLLQRAGTAQ